MNLRWLSGSTVRRAQLGMASHEQLGGNRIWPALRMMHATAAVAAGRAISQLESGL